MSDAKDEILYHLSNKENSFLCNILIYAENNNEFKIERYIEDIFPSRLKELFDAKMEVDNKPVLKSLKVPIFEEKKKTGEKNFEFNFDSIYHFFGRDNHDYSYFLDIVSSIFSEKEISYPFVLSAITRKIRKIFAQDIPTRESILRGLALMVYLEDLGLFKNHNGGAMSDPTRKQDIKNSSETRKKADFIFEQFPKFFNTPAKRAVYLEGVLCKKLLIIQQHERKATPFRTKLQGLKLDQRRVQALLPEIENKLEEYKSNYYRDLEILISVFMREAGEDWELSKDEIAFYFVLGMNLADEFKFSSQVEEGKNE
jgi:CRISPR-associated protein Csh1